MNQHTDRILQSILSCQAKLVVLDALPGTDRNIILQACEKSGWRVVSPGADINQPDPGWEAQIIVGALDQIPNAAMAHLRGDAVVFGNIDMFLPLPESAKPQQSLGWPALDRYLDQKIPDPRVSVGFVRDALASLEAPRRDVLRLLCQCTLGVHAELFSAQEIADLHWLRPLTRCDASIWKIASAEMRETLEAALAQLPLGKAWHKLLTRGAGIALSVPRVIVEAGREAALAIVADAGGPFLMHCEGPEAAAAVVHAFGDKPPPDISALAFLLAAKKGDLEAAERILSKVGGPGILDHTRALLRAEALPPSLVFCRLMLAIYRSVRVRPHMLKEAAELLARVSRRNPLLRGAIYNAILELHIREGRLTEASDAAARALAHYQIGKAPYLEFFIHLHCSVIALLQSDPLRAREHLVSGQAAIAKVPFCSPQDERFVALLAGVTSYEIGDAQPLAEFAQSAQREFTFGELWPSLAELALQRGCDALMQLNGHRAALEYIDGWRLQAWRTQRFGTMIEQRGIALSQAARRWHEARTRLEDMVGRVGRVGLDSRPHMLRELRSPEDILQSLLWLRQACFETPRNSELPERLAAMAENPVLTERHHLCLQIWRAWIDSRQGSLSEARKRLSDILERSHRRGLRAPLLEERTFLLPLLDDPRMMTAALCNIPIPQNLRLGALATVGSGPLSRQEWRTLLLLAEGCANKDIARQMGLSLPTVKFHLKNMYRKLSVTTRQEAVSIARARGMIT